MLWGSLCDILLISSCYAIMIWYATVMLFGSYFLYLVWYLAYIIMLRDCGAATAMIANVVLVIVLLFGVISCLYHNATRLWWCYSYTVLVIILLFGMISCLYHNSTWLWWCYSYGVWVILLHHATTSCYTIVIMLQVSYCMGHICSMVSWLYATTAWLWQCSGHTM